MTSYNRIVRGLLGSVYCLLLLLALLGWYLIKRLPEPPSMHLDEGGRLEWPTSSIEISELDASVFKAVARGDSNQGATLSGLPYRLAGTFLRYGAPDDNAERERKAIIDDLERGEQALLAEDEPYRDITVRRISRDHILIERDGRQHELWLSFEDSYPGEQSPQQTGDAAAGRREAGGAGNRFGRRVGENRWVFEKAALRDFYMEMLDDPARAVDIYETMRPDYDSNRNIHGYVVDIVGEEAFFDAVGLQNGDVVRKVNSWDMTSRNRAEYFIREFMKDRVDAIVLEIERGGEERKLVYLLR